MTDIANICAYFEFGAKCSKRIDRPPKILRNGNRRLISNSEWLKAHFFMLKVDVNKQKYCCKNCYDSLRHKKNADALLEGPCSDDELSILATEWYFLAIFQTTNRTQVYHF